METVPIPTENDFKKWVKDALSEYLNDLPILDAQKMRKTPL
jgi:hypothetical protein